MKALKLSIVFCMLVFTIQAQTTTRRVNSDTNVDAPYRTIQEAIDAASTDDTILVEPSVIHYAGYTCAKRVHVIGSFSKNHLPRAYATNSKSWINSGVYYMPGSEGSIVMGLTLWDPDISLTNSIYLSASEIVVKRNSIRTIYLQSKNLANVADTTHIDNCLIIQNYIYQILSYKNANGSTIIYAANLVVRNNVINYSVDLYSSYMYTDMVWANNIIQVGGFYVKNASVFNNIFEYSGLYDTPFNSQYNNVITYNIFTRVAPTCGTCVYDVGNKFGLSYSTFYTSWTTEQPPYQLAVASPALSAGVGGVDCGVWDGDYPWIHGIVSDIPAIYYFTVKPVSNTSIEVEVKAAVRP